MPISTFHVVWIASSLGLVVLHLVRHGRTFRDQPLLLPGVLVTVASMAPMGLYMMLIGLDETEILRGYLALGGGAVGSALIVLSFTRHPPDRPG